MYVTTGFRRYRRSTIPPEIFLTAVSLTEDTGMKNNRNAGFAAILASVPRIQHFHIDRLVKITPYLWLREHHMRYMHAYETALWASLLGDYLRGIVLTVLRLTEDRGGLLDIKEYTGEVAFPREEQYSL